MPVSRNVHQSPHPGQRILLFRGDVIRFRLYLDNPVPGTGWLRTNIGSAHVSRWEIIAEVDHNESPMHHDWFDIPMAVLADGGFELVLPLCEVGHFEAKVYFLPDQDRWPIWPSGDNTHINVEPAGSVCANTVYNAFIRQFGPNKKTRHKPPAEIDFKLFDAAGYTLIPPSGTFRGFMKELDFIIDELGCRYIQLLPINPTPTTYARMGRYGSPYASQSFRLVDTALAEFDLRATPMDQFLELVDAIHSRHARVILDIAINHTGWGARLHEMYGNWLKRDDEGKIEIPGAWGVLWEDLTKLDYSKKGLWQFMAMVFLTWCRRGVDGFRCDAGYMIPGDAWRYIIARVREEYPDTIFFLEGLGGKISVTRDLLNTSNLNWFYSELFQNYDRGQIHHYLPGALDISLSDGPMINFAETHDNLRLAAVSTTYARMRTALCAMLSSHGGFAFANGVEWYATEKIDVHDANPLNWGAEVNQVNHIRRLNTILKTHPAFFDRVEHRFIESASGNFLALFRRPLDMGKPVLVLANLDCDSGVTASWDAGVPQDEGDMLFDLITLQPVKIERTCSCNRLCLAAGQVACLAFEKQDMELIENAETENSREPGRIGLQRLRSKVLDVYRYHYGITHMGNFDVDAEARRLKADPVAFCRRAAQAGDGPVRVINWEYPRDLKRQVMIPPDHFLMISASVYFEARIIENERVVTIEKGLERDDGRFFVLVSPLDGNRSHRHRSLRLTVYNGKSALRPRGYVHEDAFLLYLGEPENSIAHTLFDRSTVLRAPHTLLAANGIGGLSRASSWWGYLESKYDALLAANMNPEMPENRWIMFARCRGWLVYQDYSQPIRTDCIQQVAFDEACGVMKWLYKVPAGLGHHVLLAIAIEMIIGQNRVRIHFHRLPGRGGNNLPDDATMDLILRPDIENRSFHETTKAFTGPEETFQKAVSTGKEGFVFSPAEDRHLHVEMPGGLFVYEPEWTYMVHRPLEAERGMDPLSDLFSPGYFRGPLKGGETLVLDAEVQTRQRKKSALPLGDASELFIKETAGSISLGDAMFRAMDAFVVEREQLKSVIAGYPWFLDWGRDSLIFCRGMIAAGKIGTALEIIKLFGQFEENGTLPNMITGSDARNRNTSDAPLWFMVACRDFAYYTGSEAFLDDSCGGRTLRQILFSIVLGYVDGTPNGIAMDKETGLVFSPSHFTWMDTNFPASTPRQGYPIEIQSLWYASLSFLSGVEAPSGFALANGIGLGELANRVSKAVETYFYRPGKGFLSDCLHCDPGVSPANARADDALRPNQLFAVTMGLVEDRAIGGAILEACTELLVPGGIRSLADRALEFPLYVRHNDGIIGDPYRPYKGSYEGDEDSSRKPAYHNGTAWTWVFPSFCEAWWMVYGEEGRRAARSWLGSSSLLINDGCVCHVPEIVDGDYPHAHRGCDAQAWSASELFRVWHLLVGDGPDPDIPVTRGTGYHN